MGITLAPGDFSMEIPDPPGGVRTDFSHWPVAVVIPPKAQMTDADYRAYLEWTRKYIVCTGRPYAMVLEAQGNPTVTPHQRRILGEHMRSTKSFSSKYCAGTAMVFDSTVMRGVMTAIFWMSPPDYPTKVCSSTAEAVAWAKAQIAMKGDTNTPAQASVRK